MSCCLPRKIEQVSSFVRHVSGRGHGHPPVRLEFEDRSLWDGVSIIFSFTLLSVRNLSKIAHTESCSFRPKARPPRVRSSAFTAQVARRDRAHERISTSKVDAKLGEQTKAPRQPGRSQIATGQIFRRRPWSAGPPGLCWSSRSGSPEASSPLGSRARGRCAGARSPGSHP